MNHDSISHPTSTDDLVSHPTAFADDGTVLTRVAIHLTLERTIVLRWATSYRGDPFGPLEDYRPVHEVHAAGGASPSPSHAARKLRAARLASDTPGGAS